MNRLLKNVAGQHVYFRLLTTGNVPNPGASPDVVVDQGGGGVVAGAGAMTDAGNGLYVYVPTQGETNADDVAFYFGSAAGTYPPEVVSFRTESPIVIGDVVLAEVQPHYAPAKAGNAMSLLPDQDVRNILGHVVGDLLGNIMGSVPSPPVLSTGAVDSILDRVSGVSTGVTPRQALRLLLAALVNVQVAFAVSQHVGPSGPGLKPRFPGRARRLLAATVADLQKTIAFAGANPDMGLLAPDLATACQQLSTALDAVRTSTA